MLPAAPCWAQRGRLEGRCGPSQTRGPSGGAPTPLSWRPRTLSSTPTTAAAIITSSSRNTSCSAFSFALAAAGRRRQLRSGGGAAAAANASFVVRALGCDAAAAAGADAPRVEEPSTALLQAWFACGNRSLFAAQCLVEVLVDLYREGRTFGEVQLSLKMATQGGRVQRGQATREGREDNGDGGDVAPGGETEGGEQLMLPPLLQGQEEDVLVSWVALVFLSCEELGVPRDREPVEQRQQQQQQELQQQGQAVAAAGGGDGLGAGVGLGSMAAGSAYLRGMLGYVRQTLGMYDEGQTLSRVAGLQGLVQQSSSAASSPFMVLMQQYTRLVLLTVEVVAAAGLPTARPLRPPETVARSTGYSQAFSSQAFNRNSVLEDYPELPATTAESAASGAGGGGSAAVPAVCPARGLAVRLLMAFMGAVLGSQWSLGKFVEAVRMAYDQGLAADELFLQLDEEEFVQSGGLLPIAGAASAGADASAAEAATAAAPDAVPPPPQQYQITKALLSNWISLSYMTLAQLAVPYPQAGQRLGWAWAGFGDPIEAIGMNDFVGNVLRQMTGADARAVPQPQPAPQQAGLTDDAAAAAAAVAANLSEGQVNGILSGDGGDGGGGGGDAQFPLAGGVGDRRRGAALMVRVEDEMLPTTSTAFRVLTQQVSLVQAVCARVMTEDRD